MRREDLAATRAAGTKMPVKPIRAKGLRIEDSGPNEDICCYSSKSHANSVQKTSLPPTRSSVPAKM
jgi:hypothetical protein